MNSDELIEALGDNFYEVKRLVSKDSDGNQMFVAYSVEKMAKGETVREALENLLKIYETQEDKMA